MGPTAEEDSQFSRSKKKKNAETKGVTRCRKRQDTRSGQSSSTIYIGQVQPDGVQPKR